MMSVKELAGALGVSNKTIYALVEQEAIPHYRIGVGRGTLRFEIDEVKKALTQRTETARETSSFRHLK